jgi:glutamyl-tRNA synthetase
MFNFLALLGWNPGDERVKMTRDELVAAFDLDGVGTSGAVFDLTKLEWLNGLYVTAMSPPAFEEAARPVLEEAGLWQASFAVGRRDWFRSVLALLQPRAKTLAAIPDEGRFFFVADDALTYDTDALRKQTKDASVTAALAELAEAWQRLPDWSLAPLESTLRSLAERHALKAGQLIHPVRLAVTGRAASPGLFEVVALLGRDVTLARLRRLLDRVSAGLV